MPYPKQTPWGPSQNQKQIAEGIVSYSTASHGGFGLSQVRLAEMPPDLRAFQPWAGEGWYEEDCDWAVVCLAFPQFFDEVQYYFAIQALKGEYGRGIVTPERQAKADAWLSRNTDKFTIGGCCTSGGDWDASAYSLVNRDLRLIGLFQDYPPTAIGPAVFTRRQFESAALKSRVEQPASPIQAPA